MAKKPKTLDEATVKKRPVKLRDLAPRRKVKGGSQKCDGKTGNKTVPTSLEDFLRSNSLQIDS
jgi:hypothetical protein